MPQQPKGKTVAELRALIKKAGEVLQAEMPLIVEKVAATLKAIAERNINDKGFGPKYSENGVPVFFFLGKELNQKGTAWIKRRQKETAKANKANDTDDVALGTWAEFRAAEGLPNDHVTLNYSGAMWRGMVVTSQRREGDTFVAVLAHTNIEGQQKMNWNYARYKDFLRLSLSEDDREFLQKYALDLVIETLKNIGLL